jgi:hypothetical protein
MKLDEPIQIPLCMSKLSEKYLEPENPGGNALILIGILQHPKYNQRIVLREIFDSRAYSMSIMIKNSNASHVDANVFRGKTTGYMILIDEPQELHNQIKLMKSLPSWNPNAEVVVLLMTHIKEENALATRLKSVLNITFSYGMLDVNVVYQHPKSDHLVESATWFPYEKSGCAKNISEIRVIDQCEWLPSTEEFAFKTFFPNLYPKIPAKFHGCPLKITAVVNEPYVFDANLTKKNGSEYNLFAEISDQLELTPVFNVQPDTAALRVYTDDPRSGFYAPLLKG